MTDRAYVSTYDREENKRVARKNAGGGGRRGGKMHENLRAWLGIKSAAIAKFLQTV